LAKDIIIFGLGQIAELAAFYFKHDADRRVVAFTVDGAFLSGDHFCDRPAVAFEDVVRDYPPADYDMFVAVSYAKLNALRASKVAEATAKGYALTSYVSSRAQTFPGFSHGANCFILENNVIQPFARIGANVTLWSGNHIGHHAAIGDNAFLASHIVISGGVDVGDSCFIGVNATVRDHVRIGARAIIGAGALVLADVPERSVIAPSATEISKVPSDRIRRI